MTTCGERFGHLNLRGKPCGIAVKDGHGPCAYHDPTNGTKPANGRQSLYSEAAAEKVLDLLAHGTPLNKICRENPDLPSPSAIISWANEDREGFAKRYAHARSLQCDVWADEVIEISDDGANDTYLDGKGNVKTDHDVVARSRLRVDARKWILSKLRPEVYADRAKLEAPDEAIRHEHTEIPYDNIAAARESLARGMATASGSSSTNGR